MKKGQMRRRLAALARRESDIKKYKEGIKSHRGYTTGDEIVRRAAVYKIIKAQEEVEILKERTR